MSTETPEGEIPQHSVWTAAPGRPEPEKGWGEAEGRSPGLCLWVGSEVLFDLGASPDLWCKGESDPSATDPGRPFQCLLKFNFQNFWACHKACRILVPWPGIEPSLPTLETERLNHWTTREVTLLFNRPVVSNSLKPYGLQHIRLPCPSSSPGVVQIHVHWVSDAIQPSHPLFLLLLSSIFPSISVFSSQLALHIGGPSTGASASPSVLPMSIQNWSPLGFTGLISLQSKRLSRIFSNTTIWKHQFFSTQPSLWSNSHIHTWLLESYDYTDLYWQSDVSAF